MRLPTEPLGPRHGEVRRAHQMLSAALYLFYLNIRGKGRKPLTCR